jgi:tetratricopeptide (TPR) repeat protein
VDLETTSGSGDLCPSLEAIAAYLDRRLTARERDQVCTHLTACDTCYVIFLDAARTQRVLDAQTAHDAAETKGPRWRLAWPSWPWTPAVTRRVAWSSASGLAAAAVLALLVWSGGTPFNRTRGSAMQQLIAAVSSERPIEPRVSGGFKYAQVRAPLRAGDGLTRGVTPELKQAAGEIDQQLSAERTLETVRAAGVAALLMEDVDRATELLQEAFGLAPNDAGLLNDLSAAYLVRASRGNSRIDLRQALAMADGAIKIDPRLVEAWFNRALALESQGVVEDARAAWQEYLDMDKNDDTSGWAGEARQHLARLR